MDEDTATRFVSSLVKSIQALCNGYIDFSSSIEVVGHIHLNIDRNKKLDYVLTEEVSKSVSEGATVFASHSYHSHPPPSASSKTSGDASNQNRRKSQVSRDNDPLSITSLPPEVPNTSRSHSSSRVEENSDSSGSANYSQDFTPVKSENNRTSCQVQESLDRRRKGVPLSHTHRTQSPAAKRPRNHDTSSAVQNPGFDVIEIKEEPDDEPSVYFGDNSSSNMGAGQDIQTPDFSNVVMESLDRVGQIEGTQLVAGGDSGQQHQPFPVMLHTNPGMPSSSSQGPGPSLNPQSTASTSGASRGQPGLALSAWRGENNKAAFSHQHHSHHHHSHQQDHQTATAASHLYSGNDSADGTAVYYEQQRQHRNEVIKAAVDYVMQSGLPPYRVCTMFNIAQATLYRHVVKAQKRQRQESAERTGDFADPPGGPCSVVHEPSASHGGPDSLHRGEADTFQHGGNQASSDTFPCRREAQPVYSGPPQQSYEQFLNTEASSQSLEKHQVLDTETLLPSKGLNSQANAQPESSSTGMTPTPAEIQPEEIRLQPRSDVSQSHGFTVFHENERQSEGLLRNPEESQRNFEQSAKHPPRQEVGRAPEQVRPNAEAFLEQSGEGGPNSTVLKTQGHRFDESASVLSHATDTFNRDMPLGNAPQFGGFASSTYNVIDLGDSSDEMSDSGFGMPTTVTVKKEPNEHTNF
ncbi:uncharacterized protein [Littorina saxatilis]|uniref:uncharacterized protein isoform X2 n=1 Tax=Littorina saxatilis TaxID=31220 RepID=UPI0038B52E84